MKKPVLNKIYDTSRNNKTLITDATLVGCFSCLNQFPATEIDEQEYVDGGETALCPKCGVDAIIPLDSIPEDIRKVTLHRLFDRYFMS